MYIDYGICASKSISDAEKANDTTVSDIDKAGFIVNATKSHQDTVQVLEWL